MANGSNGSSSNGQWPLFGQNRPKNCIIFFCQVTLIFLLVITSIINLSVRQLDGVEDKVWVALLSWSVGYLLPGPKLKSLTPPTSA